MLGFPCNMAGLFNSQVFQKRSLTWHFARRDVSAINFPTISDLDALIFWRSHCAVLKKCCNHPQLLASAVDEDDGKCLACCGFFWRVFCTQSELVSMHIMLLDHTLKLILAHAEPCEHAWNTPQGGGFMCLKCSFGTVS